jgi:hypothetical protein
MQPMTRTEIERIKESLSRAQVACAAAIESGDCRAVAHSTCEAARLRHVLEVSGKGSKIA